MDLTKLPTYHDLHSGAYGPYTIYNGAGSDKQNGSISNGDLHKRPQGYVNQGYGNETL